MVTSRSGPWLGALLWLPALVGCGTLVSDPLPVPSATKNVAVIFDIDGTLTPDPNSIKTARADAARVVSMYEKKGYQVIYVSQRFRWLQGSIPDFLKDNQFPRGSVQVPQSLEASLPSNACSFKLAALKAIVAKGWRVAKGYGDKETDFLAYRGIGLAQKHVFALKPEDDAPAGGCHGSSTQWAACLSNYTSHLATVEAMPVHTADALQKEEAGICKKDS
jgi:phosphatidate phosphatase PAH1